MVLLRRTQNLTHLHDILPLKLDIYLRQLGWHAAYLKVRGLLEPLAFRFVRHLESILARTADVV
jgi:hypothetical protein